jgi:hypothetical protein
MYYSRPSSGFKEMAGACKPLMREKDLEVQAKAIEVTGRQVSHGPRETAEQIKARLANIEAGKGLQGGEHLGKAKDVPGRKFGDYVEPTETVEEEKDTDETDLVEAVDDEVYPVIGDEDGDIGDIPGMPGVIEPTLDIILEPIVDPKEIEENVEPEPEITSKATKENLINAGHVDPVPKAKLVRAPTEEDKQALFDKCVFQAFVWDVHGDEMVRRLQKAIRYVDPDKIEEAQKRLGGRN